MNITTGYEQINSDLLVYSSTIERGLINSLSTTDLIEIVWDYDDLGEELKVSIIVTPQDDDSEPINYDLKEYYDVPNISFATIAFDLSNRISQFIINRYDQ